MMICLLLVAPVQAEQYGGTIHIRAANDPLTLNPFMVSHDAFAWDLSYAINGYLYVIAPDGTFQPDLAHSWDISDDNQVITFYLREDVTFHDGSPFTANDVVFTFSSILDPDFGSTWHTNINNDVEKVEKVDTYTVNMYLKNPTAAILYNLLIPIAPEQAYKEKGADFAYDPIGAGPFEFVEWVPDSYVLLKANDDFYGGRPYVDELRFQIMDYDTALMAFMAGNIDVLGLADEDLAILDEHGELDMAQKPGTSWYYLGLNLDREPLDDQRVRQAISYGINRQEIIDTYFEGAMTYATGPIIPQSWAYNPDVNTYEYNPRKAITLLQEAGYSEGVTVELKLRTTASTLGEIIQSQLALVGITVDLVPMEWGLLLDALDALDFDMWYMAWTRQVDPSHGIDRQFKTETNLSTWAYSNPELDRLAVEALETFDLDERREKYFRIQEILAEELPAIFLWYGYHRSAYNTRLQEFDIDPLYSYRTYTHVWIEE